MTATMRAVVLDAPAGGRMPRMDGLEAVGVVATGASQATSFGPTRRRLRIWVVLPGAPLPRSHRMRRLDPRSEARCEQRSGDALRTDASGAAFLPPVTSSPPRPPSRPAT
jgi:hypothetical protein